MKYILELESDNIPTCKQCLLSYHKFADEERLYCMGLANRPRCPITGRLNICPLKESEKEYESKI